VRTLSEFLAFLLSWVVTSLLLYLAHIIFPGSIVLGTYRFSVVEAAVYSAFWISFLNWAIKDIAIARKLHPESKFGSLVFYILVGSVSVWLVARAAPLSGLGLVSYRWALLLGLFIGSGFDRMKSFIKTSR